MESIVDEIKLKKELSDIPDDLITSSVNEYLKKHKIGIPKSKKTRKILIKEVRAELRKYSGQYSSLSSLKKEKLIHSGKFDELLEHHVSTRERINDYEKLREIINSLNVKSILDLGCGLNPLAIASKDVSYHAYDIKMEDLDIVSAFFKANGINGDVHNIDIRKADNFPDVDLCLILKVLDILGGNKSEISKRIISKISAKNFIISFATKTLSGRPMNRPYRRWFEKLIDSLKLKYHIFKSSQEIFYIIRV